jgi:hypothetical protein
MATPVRGLPGVPSSSGNVVLAILLVGIDGDPFRAAVGGRLRLRFGVLKAGSAGFILQSCLGVSGVSNWGFQLLECWCVCKFVGRL